MNKRDELEGVVDNTLDVVIEGPYQHDKHTERIMAAADAYGDERERKGKLAGHVGACKESHQEETILPGGETHYAKRQGCGEKWLCDKAKAIKGEEN